MLHVYFTFEKRMHEWIMSNIVCQYKYKHNEARGNYLLK